MKEKVIAFIKDYYKKNNMSGAVIGISGGKDSAVCTALMVEALGKENVYGLWLPCFSREIDKKDAYDLARYYDISLEEFDLSFLFTSFVDKIKTNYHVEEDDLFDANINIKPRMRMMCLYYYAQMLTKTLKKPMLVVGTSNACERYVGYFTKGGDNVSDIAPIANLTVSEVLKLGEELMVPKNILYKVPSDGLRDISDEEVLGIKYRDIEVYMDEEKKGIKTNLIDDNTRNKIKSLHEKNQHKFFVPSYQKCD